MVDADDDDPAVKEGRPGTADGGAPRYGAPDRPKGGAGLALLLLG